MFSVSVGRTLLCVGRCSAAPGAGRGSNSMSNCSSRRSSMSSISAIFHCSAYSDSERSAGPSQEVQVHRGARTIPQHQRPRSKRELPASRPAEKTVCSSHFRINASVRQLLNSKPKFELKVTTACQAWGITGGQFVLLRSEFTRRLANSKDSKRVNKI